MSSTDSAATLAERLRELHKPWWETNGVRHDHTVCIYSDDVGKVGHDHVCRVGFEWDNCDPENEQHYALACIECRQTTEDGDPSFPIWPCATIRAVEEYAERASSDVRSEAAHG